MKNILLTTLLVSSISFGQTNNDFLKLNIYDINEGLRIQNDVREYFDLNPYEIDSSLSEKAQIWAKYLAKVDSLEISTDEYGESVYVTEKSYINDRNKSLFKEAILNWLIYNEEQEASAYQQIISKIATKIGVGFYSNSERYYVVAKYDSIY